MVSRVARRVSPVFGSFTCGGLVCLIPKYRSTASKGFRTTCFNSNGFSDASGKRAVPVKHRKIIRG